MADAEASSRLAQFVAPVVIAIVVIIVLLAAIHTSTNESAYLRSNGQASNWTGSNQQFQCLRAAFQKEVPRGSTVYVGDTEVGDIGSIGSARMVAVIAATWAVPVARSLARREVRIFFFGNECVGLTLSVEQLR